MPFNLETWKDKVYEQLWDWRSRMQQAQAVSVYMFLSATALWPVVAAVRQGDWGALFAVGGVVSGVGTNLLANFIQQWKDEAHGWQDEADGARQIAAAVAAEPTLRSELDAILEQVETFTQAKQVLPEAERHWFVETLRGELERLGNTVRFEAHLTGSGAIAQGDQAKAVGAKGTLINGNVEGDYLAPGASKTVHVAAPALPPPQVEARRQYLTRLCRYCQALPLAALGAEEGSGQDITLDQVYVALDTTTQVEQFEATQQRKHRDRQWHLRQQKATDRLTALDVAEHVPRLVLLGAPGAGKSTFVRKILAWLAAAHLHDNILAPAGMSNDLLPILITLRDLAPRLATLDLSALSDEDRGSTLAATVREHAVATLERWEARDFASELQEALVAGRCLLVLDGLDEVPHDLRRRSCEAVWAVLKTYTIQRVMVTCRVQSYVGEAVLPGFQAHTLQAFDKQKITDFAHAWYNAQKELGQVDAQQAERKAADLAKAALTDELQELAANPMMLTTMAIIHQREVGLPRERVRLYNLAVEVLLRRWQQSKTGETRLTSHPALAALLADDRRLRLALEGLAYETLRHQQDRPRTELDGNGPIGSGSVAWGMAVEGSIVPPASPLNFGDQPASKADFSLPNVAAWVADVMGRAAEMRVPEALHVHGYQGRQVGVQPVVTDMSRGEALVFLEQPAYLGDVGLAAVFLDYVDQRAGLLVGQGGGLDQQVTYTFPHRTFQEYLAACHLVGQRHPARVLFAHAGEGDSWNLVVRLGAEELRYNRPRPHELLDLAYSLCPETVSPEPKVQRAVLWSGIMAMLAGRATIERDISSPRGGLDYMARLRPRLIELLHSNLTTSEQANAKAILLHLGAWRFRADAWHLPYEPLLGFVEIPAGPFRMGSDRARDADTFGNEQPQHEVELPGYYVARYPVTVAQFRAFVEASGYKPTHPQSLHGPLHQPVVKVTWYDALAYCDWLTNQLRLWSGTPKPLAYRLREQGGRVTLPSEAEWEKAARGTDGRRYPWGKDPDPSRANYSATGIFGASAVGCFPEGASVYGVEDLSGNVWEWTRSLQGTYPYPAEKAARAQREDLEASEAIRRVLRGGAFWSDGPGVRCATRDDSSIRRANDNIGFRVVVTVL